MKDIQELISCQRGDIVSLSDFQTCAEFKGIKVDFQISRVRNYEDQEGRFSIVAYELEGPNEETPYMLVIKIVGEDYDVFVYYLDNAGEFDGDPENPYAENILTEDEDNLVDRIEVDVHYEEGDLEVVWDLQDQTHGVRYEDDAEDEGICTIAEYYTEDDNKNNQYCLVDWKGDSEDGSIEMWYGCLIKDHEVEIIPVED
jgi:hypothetical protein